MQARCSHDGEFFLVKNESHRPVQTRQVEMQPLVDNSRQCHMCTRYHRCYYPNDRYQGMENKEIQFGKTPPLTDSFQ